jgi:FMN-dependent NADH-azoreductase
MSLHHHLRKHGVGFVTKHPYLATILGLTGISAVVSVVTGAHKTPPPSQQNQTNPTKTS